LNQKLYEQLELSISKDRLDEYANILKTNKTKTIFTYYILNSEISKSLYIPLQNLEVALRNNIHKALAKYHDTDKWYEVENFLSFNEIKKINEAKHKLSKSRQEITASKVISELSFGFWTSLFNKNYDQKIWNKHIKQIFPNMPKYKRNRIIVSEQINAIRYYRNRIFHFDHIFSKKDLPQIHINILNMIKWLNLALYDVTIEFDEFNDICKNETKNTIKKLNKINKNYS